MRHTVTMGTGGLVSGTASMWARPDFDAELSYELTKWLGVNYDLFKDKGHRLKTYTLECLKVVADTALAPVHAGTVRYLKEKGLWSAANDARQAYNTRLMGLYCRTWEAAIARADRTGVEVTPANTAWVRLWANCKKEAGLPPINLLNDAEIIEGLAGLDHLSSPPAA